MGLLSGLLGFLGDQKANKAAAKQYEMQVDYQNYWRQNERQYDRYELDRLRTDATRAGFNPAAVLGMFGGGGGGGVGFSAPGAPPPLASTQALSDIGSALEDEISGDADRRRAADQLNLDMAKLKLEQARSGVVAVGTSAADAVGKGPSTFARNTPVVSQSAGTVQPRLSFGKDDNFLVGNREEKIAPVENISGFMKVVNRFTGPEGVWVPGSDGDISDIGEVLTMIGIGGPQVAWRAGNKMPGLTDVTPEQWAEFYKKRKAEDDKKERDQHKRAPLLPFGLTTIPRF